MKITGQPHRKACKLNFYWKICSNFIQGPSFKGQKFEGPPFASGPPNNCCERSLTVGYNIMYTTPVASAKRF